jgi:hypothetical protein
MRQSSLLEFDIPENKFIIINYIYFINAKSLIKVTIHVFLLKMKVIPVPHPADNLPMKFSK